MQTRTTQNDIDSAPSVAAVLPDTELTNRARGILRWKPRYNSVHVVAANGHVILWGEVLSQSDREAAEQTVRKLRGVVGLTNRIVTMRPRLRKSVLLECGIRET